MAPWKNASPYQTVAQLKTYLGLKVACSCNATTDAGHFLCQLVVFLQHLLQLWSTFQIFIQTVISIIVLIRHS